MALLDSTTASLTASRTARIVAAAAGAVAAAHVTCVQITTAPTMRRSDLERWHAELQALSDRRKAGMGVLIGQDADLLTEAMALAGLGLALQATIRTAIAAIPAPVADEATGRLPAFVSPATEAAAVVTAATALRDALEPFASAVIADRDAVEAAIRSAI